MWRVTFSRNSSCCTHFFRTVWFVLFFRPIYTAWFNIALFLCTCIKLALQMNSIGMNEFITSLKMLCKYEHHPPDTCGCLSSIFPYSHPVVINIIFWWNYTTITLKILWKVNPNNSLYSRVDHSFVQETTTGEDWAQVCCINVLDFEQTV